MRCLVVINNLSGNSARVDVDALRRIFADGYETDVFYIKSYADEWTAKGYSRVIVVGGDGTFNRAINSQLYGAELIYVSGGTFNELAKTYAKRNCCSDLGYTGIVNGRRFAYVLACGTFTPLGYTVSCREKHRLRVFAYFKHVLSEYRPYSIKATITADGKTQSGIYTLIMLINSKRCFGLNFNRLFQSQTPELQLLTIRGYKHNNLFTKIAMFFPFFRVFFLGMGKECKRGRITFTTIGNATIKLDKETTFCMDGEAYTTGGELNVHVAQCNGKVLLYNKSFRRGS